jgi:hypothetical protein
MLAAKLVACGDTRDNPRFAFAENRGEFRIGVKQFACFKADNLSAVIGSAPKKFFGQVASSFLRFKNMA